MDTLRPECRQQIEAILDDALEIAVEQRATFLSLASGRDPELQRRVEALLTWPLLRYYEVAVL
jgi:hypothetical protein